VAMMHTTHTTRRRSAALIGVLWPLALLVGACATPAAKPDAAMAPAPARSVEPASARPAVQLLLREMSRAVEGADQKSYLGMVSQEDPIFALEQKNWARDLARKPVSKFEMRLAEKDGEPPELTPDAAGVVSADVSFTWQMPDAKERTLTFPARFVRSGKGYVYAGENWKTLEAPGVRVYFAEGAEEAAKTIADVLPGVREHVHQVFGLEGEKSITERTQEVKVYRSMKHLQFSIYPSYTDGLAGWNEPGESIKLLSGRTASKGMMRTLLGHEYGHVATFELGPKANDMPWWILEGVAEFSAEKYSKDRAGVDRIVRRWGESGKLVAWDDLADFHGEALNHQQQVYTQGHHMIIYVTDRFGDAKRNAWLRAMSKGESLEGATKGVLGLSFAELDAQWRESLKAPKEEPAGKE
jgi:hypothetical protein